MMGLFVAVIFGMSGCGGGSGNNAPNNKITAAEAGPAQNVIDRTLVTLNGSQSTGADGSLITYQWSMVSKPVGSVATIINPTTVNPTFTPDLPGQYSLKLMVTDAKSISSEDTITVTVTASVANAAPVANAGAAQSIVTGAVVTLDGSASSDANGDLLTYSWSFTSKPAGSSAALSNATFAKPTFTADVPGAYVLNLLVNDGKVNSTTATVTINASVANAAPVANAGAAQSVVAGAVVTLDGSASSDANGDILTYSWSFTSKPAGSNAALTSATAVKPTFTADVAGAYVMNLVVNDGKVNSAATTVTITASVANAAPVASAGAAQSVVTGAVVTLNGSASSDANGDLLTYSWAFTSKPAGSNAALSSATVAKPTFTADVAGAYVLNLLVNDGKVNSAVTTVTIAASAPTVLSISKISADPGANYAGVAYSQPFIVKVTDQNGTPIRNQAVNWTADTDGWPIPASTVTDVNGQTSTYWVTGSSVTPNLTASTGNTQGTAIVSFAGSTKTWPIRPDHLAVSYSENFPVATGIARDVTPLTDPTGTYYAVMQWDNGYTGIQRGGSNYDRQIQFSIWNYNGVPSSIVDAGTSICQDFSHEGSGVMCSNTYPWIAGNTYRFEMTSVASSSSTTDITVYFIDVASGTRKFIATLRQNGTPNLTWALSFVEDFILNDISCLTVLERRAIFGNTKYLVNSTWINTSHSGTFLPWDPKTYCANQGYVLRSNGIEMGVGGTFKANSISTSIPVSY
jgi:hypothetical protein